MAAGGAGQPTILVTDAGRGSAVSIIRSLGGRGWTVIAGDADRHSIGFRSRHVAKRFVYPSPADAPGEFTHSVIEAASRWRIDLIIPVTDAVILPLSAERARLEGVSQVAMPDPEALRVVTDKRRTLELAEHLGVPTPRSVLVDSPEAARSAAAELGWPVVLKPKSSRIYHSHRSIESFEVAYANSPEEVTARLEASEGRHEILVQEYCGGEGCGVGLLLHEGRPLAAFQHRRLHEVPFTGGASSLRESVPLDPVLYDHSVRLLGALRWTGLAMVEFKVGVAGPKLMEINGRVWGSLPLAVMSRVDFPRLLAELYLSGPPSGGVGPQLSYRVGVRARNLALDLVWIGSTLAGRRKYPYLKAPGRGQGLAGLLGLLDPRCRSDIMALDDPGPGMGEIPMVVGKLWQKVWNRN